MKIRLTNSFFAVFIVLVANANTGFADLETVARNECTEVSVTNSLFQNVTKPEKRVERRASFLRALMDLNIPLILKKNGRGEEIPVALINEANHAKIRAFLENSVGFIVEHKPDAPQHMDHGIFRFSQYVSDSNTPSIRSYGEIHRTGIAWSRHEDMISYGAASIKKGKTSNPGIEVVFFPEKSEMEDIKYYLMVRRAAIVRVRNSFDSKNLGKIGDNYLESSSEHCFTYSKCQVAAGALSQMDQRIQQLTGKSASEHLAKPEVKKWLGDVQKRLASMEIEIDIDRAAQEFYPEMVWKAMQSESEAMRNIIVPTNLTEPQKLEFVNWLVGYDSFSKMSRFLAHHEITSEISYTDYNSNYAVGVLIYDYTDSAISKFQDASYTSSGSNTAQWTSSGQTAVKK